MFGAAVSSRPAEDSSALEFLEAVDPSSPAAIESAITGIGSGGEDNDQNNNGTVDLRHHHRPYYGGNHCNQYAVHY
jgi:hypothetical protein